MYNWYHVIKIFRGVYNYIKNMAISKVYIPATPRSKAFKYYTSSASRGGGSGTTSIIQQPNTSVTPGVAINKIGTGTVVVDIAGNAEDEAVLDVTMGEAVGGTYWGQTPVNGVVKGKLTNADGVTPTSNNSYEIGSSTLNYARLYVNRIENTTTSNMQIASPGYSGGKIRDFPGSIWAISRKAFIGAYDYLPSGTVEGIFNSNSALTLYSDQIGYVGLNNLSDRARKKNIEELDEYSLSSIKLYRFQYIDDKYNKSRVGLIAQEVEAVIPEAVIGDEGNKMLSYDAVTAVLLDKVNRLEERIRVLEKNQR